MSTETIAPGLPADWLNGWLAALGITVLVPGVRLSWTDTGVPKARFDVPAEQPLASRVAAAFPDDFSELSIAGLHRKVPLRSYQHRAGEVRTSHDFSLAASVTDLGRTDDETAEHSPFDPPAPRGETLHTRLERCSQALNRGESLAGAIEATLDGQGHRMVANGLGFDARRLASAATGDRVTVDPVVECLAFFGLSFFPIRGTGTTARARGWTQAGTRRGAFSWPVWQVPVDQWAIDALLDRWYLAPERSSSYGVVGAFRSVPFQPEVSSDVKRGYGSERVR